MTKRQCIKIAKQYETRREWRKADIRSYKRAKRHRWMLACTEHMKNFGRLQRRKTTHTFMSARNEAREYPTRTQWYKGNQRSYGFARANNLIDKCFRHAPKKNKPRTVMCIETGKIYPGVRAAVKATKLTGVPMVLSGRLESAKGYSFIYLD